MITAKERAIQVAEKKSKEQSALLAEIEKDIDKNDPKQVAFLQSKKDEFNGVDVKAAQAEKKLGLKQAKIDRLQSDLEVHQANVSQKQQTLDVVKSSLEQVLSSVSLQPVKGASLGVKSGDTRPLPSIPVKAPKEVTDARKAHAIAFNELDKAKKEMGKIEFQLNSLRATMIPDSRTPLQKASDNNLKKYIATLKK